MSNQEILNRATVPAVLIYADLMDTANGRCIEAAQKIKENHTNHYKYRKLRSI